MAASNLTTVLLFFMFQLALTSTSVFVNTPFGNINGFRSMAASQVCHAFLGIPYAEPPVGHLRFESPIPWTRPYHKGALDATEYHSSCLQRFGQKGAEDCLYLNVWRPEPEETVMDSEQEPSLAVMLWIHGGAFEHNSGSDYSGCRLAASGNVVVASLNYRLGIFGFGGFQYPGTSYIETNWGIQDQREGMKWIAKHVRAFGGDAQRVTLFGESAGGISIWHHASSPLSQGLFRAAITQSGMKKKESPYDALEKTSVVASELGCGGASDVRACLRAVDGPTLANSSSRYGLKPLTEGQWNPSATELEGDGVGEIVKVPMLVGYNSHESNFWIYREFPQHMEAEEQIDYLQRMFRVGAHQNISAEQAAAALKPYNEALPGDPRAALSSLMQDLIWLCKPMGLWLDHMSHAPVFVYHFNYRPSCGADVTIPGVYHTIEIQLVFGEPLTNTCAFDEKDEAMVESLQERWTNFAKFLDPNGEQDATADGGTQSNEFGTMPFWPHLDLLGRKTLLMDEASFTPEPLPLGAMARCSAAAAHLMMDDDKPAAAKPSLRSVRSLRGQKQAASQAATIDE